MAQTASTHQRDLTRRYDRVAGAWGDKMRTLGYFDGYLGFLSDPASEPGQAGRVIDIGCGSGAFAEAWCAIHGQSSDMTLSDPSPAMLERAQAALARRGVQATSHATGLEGFRSDQAFDTILAAHVIEHFAAPSQALRQMRDLARPGARLWLVASKPHWCNAIIWFQWRHRTFARDELDQLLASAGWRLKTTYSFPSGPPSRTSRGYVAEAI